MDKDFWNQRYQEENFAYGKAANDFLQTNEFKTGSKILCLAEGEGRNGVYLAKMGHQITCIDYSEVGIQKMQRLAEENNVQLETICADLAEVILEPNTWDGIVLIFGHFPKELRKYVHKQVYSALKPGGKLVMEAYHKNQLNFKTGGPMSDKLLYSEEELISDFDAFNIIQIEMVERDVKEGQYHFGKASVIQVIGMK
jgi:2-polyprenyl-3-methyl-5-hydroxy-6-metoxy-1,4-benzoquinol methylase